MIREITYAEALLEAQEQLLEHHDEVMVMGLGVPTQVGVFGTTAGLVDKFGPHRVLEVPAAENGMTGIAVGAAISGMKPILTHNRVDFAVLSMEPLVNQAAKWHYMYGGTQTCPITVRMLIGRGWGQGPQHAQSLQAWFAHVPGLRVIMPTTPADAKGMLIAAVLDSAPVIVLEHRWLYDIVGLVDDAFVPSVLDRAVVRVTGSDVTLVGTSYMTLECLRAATILAHEGISAEVIDLRSIAPLDFATVESSVARTGRLVVADTGHTEFGTTAEIFARLLERGTPLLSAPVRLGLPFGPTPTSSSLTDSYYPRTVDILRAVAHQLGLGADAPWLVDPDAGMTLDQPNREFTGPY